MDQRNTNVQHTPGPWSTHAMGADNTTDCSKDGFVAHTVYIGAGDVLLGSFEAYRFSGPTPAGYERPSDFEVNKANARLAIAAPDLLAALKDARQFMSIASDRNLDEVERNGEMRSTHDWIADLDAVIARATGAA